MSRLWMWLGCGLMIAGAAYLIWRQGTPNSLGWIMLLLCPLLHLFMMRGHGHGGHSHQNGDRPADAKGHKKHGCH